MDQLPTFVLPGLHGGVELLDEFQRLAPPSFAPQLLPLPEQMSNYDELVDHFEPQFAVHDSCALIGESFSGPLAVRLATRLGERVKLLVVVASFARSPWPLLVRTLPWQWLVRGPMPTWAMRRLMMGANAPAKDVAEMRTAVRRLAPRVFAARLREIGRIDVRPELTGLSAPAIYLHGRGDWLVTANHARDFAAPPHHWPVAEIDGRHMLLETRPAECWTAISQFAANTWE